MAQIGRRRFAGLQERYFPGSCTGKGDVAGRRAARLAARLRLAEVPTGTLAAIALLAALALVLGMVLLGRGEFAHIGRDGASDAPQSVGSADANASTESDEAAAAASSGVDAGADVSGEGARLTVHVAGAVCTPGVYELPSDCRVVDAVEAAGGLSFDADADLVNLAEPLRDGVKVAIPRKGERPANSETSAVGLGGGGSGAVHTAAVNINTADAATLQELPGIGPALADRIVAEREAHGWFASVDDLMRVSGIGSKKLDGIRDQVVL